jgi:hypothetical protein
MTDKEKTELAQKANINDSQKKQLENDVEIQKIFDQYDVKYDASTGVSDIAVVKSKSLKELITSFFKAKEKQSSKGGAVEGTP